MEKVAVLPVPGLGLRNDVTARWRAERRVKPSLYGLINVVGTLEFDDFMIASFS